MTRLLVCLVAVVAGLVVVGVAIAVTIVILYLLSLPFSLLV